MLNVELKGLRELELKLMALEPKISRKIIRQAVSKAINPIKDLARENAPQATAESAKRSQYPDRKGSPNHPPPGTLKRAVVAVRNNKASRPGKEVYMVVVRRGYTSKGNRKNDGYYANFMENKFAAPQTKGLQFMRRAFRDLQDKAVETFREELQKGIEANW